MGWWIWVLLWFRETCDILRGKTQSRTTAETILILFSWPSDWFQWKHTISVEACGIADFSSLTRIRLVGVIKWRSEMDALVRMDYLFPPVPLMRWSVPLPDTSFHAFSNVALHGCSGKLSHLPLSFAALKHLIMRWGEPENGCIWLILGHFQNCGCLNNNEGHSRNSFKVLVTLLMKTSWHFAVCNQSYP